MISEPDTTLEDNPLDMQRENPSLSLPHCIVIIPAHNESEDIAFVIGEIQKYSNFPVVVVDDAGILVGALNVHDLFRAGVM